MKKVLNIFTTYNTFFLAVVLSVVSTASLFHSGLPPTHDGEYHVIRFYEFDKTLRAGSIYPVWAADLNFTYGVPLFNYVYPLPNYIASFSHAFGAGFIDAFKLNLIIATIIGAVTSFTLGRQKFGKWGGLLTSVFYTYAPYHFLDIYIRGSVGEVWALAFFPLPIIFINRIIKKRTISDVLFLSISITAIIFSHNILSLMYMGFIASYLLFLFITRTSTVKAALYIFSGLCLSLALSSIFILPALFESKYVLGLNTFTVTDHFPDLVSLLIPSWGSGYSGVISGDQMSFQIGVANMLIVLIVICSLLFKKFKKEVVYVIFFVVWFIFLMFLMNPSSAFIWRMVSGMNYFQFPWRLLSLVIFVCAVLSGSLASAYRSKIFYITLIVVVVISTYQYAKPPYFFNRIDSHYTSRPNFMYGTNSIGNGFQTKWLGQQKILPKEKAKIIAGTGTLALKDIGVTSQTYKAEMDSGGVILFNTAYFPGWTVYDNGKKVDIDNSSGLISARVYKGAQDINVKLEDTPIRTISKLLSAITFLVVIVILLRITVIQWIYDSRNR